MVNQEANHYDSRVETAEEFSKVGGDSFEESDDEDMEEPEIPVTKMGDGVFSNTKWTQI